MTKSVDGYDFDNNSPLVGALYVLLSNPKHSPREGDCAALLDIAGIRKEEWNDLMFRTSEIWDKLRHAKEVE